MIDTGYKMISVKIIEGILKKWFKDFLDEDFMRQQIKWSEEKASCYGESELRENAKNNIL